jgi:hypothetical protein
MKYRSMIALETLESRTLYSAAPSPTITADMEAVQAAEAQRFNDKAEWRSNSPGRPSSIVAGPIHQEQRTGAVAVAASERHHRRT